MSGAAQRKKSSADGPPAGGAGVSVYLVAGSDEFRASQHARRLLDAICPEQDRLLGLEEIDARVENADQAVQVLRRCLVAIRTLGFLGGRKVVWLRDANFLPPARLSARDDVRRWLDELIALVREGLPAGHVLLVTSDGADKRTAFFKACDKAGQTAVFDRPEKSYQWKPYAEDAARQSFDEAGIAIDAEAVSEFVQRVGTDSRLVRQEVDKLAAYVGERRRVSAADVLTLVPQARESAGWDLSEALARREPRRAVWEMRNLLRQGENPIGVLTQIDNRFRDLALLRESLDRGWVRAGGYEPEWDVPPDVASQFDALGDRSPRRLHPYRAKLLIEQAARFRAPELSRIRSEILKVREQLVSGFSDPELLLELLVLKLVSVRTRAPAPRPVAPAAPE